MPHEAVLATIMALLGILGYQFGLRAAVLTAAIAWAGLLLIARSGSAMARLLASSVAPTAATATLLLALSILIVLSAGLGCLRRLRGRPSGLALLLGLANGYLAGASLLDVVIPGLGLGLPFGLVGQLDASQRAGVSILGLPGLGQLSEQLQGWTRNADEQTLGWMVTAVIALFVVWAVRFGDKRTKAR